MSRKKTLIIGAAVYLLVIGVAGFLLFAKQSPIAWDVKQAYGSLCACASCTVQDCVGSEEKGSPLLESYISGDEQYTNINAEYFNRNQIMIAYTLGISTILYLITLNIIANNNLRGKNEK